MSRKRWRAAAEIAVNKIWLCLKHHDQAHKIGRDSFSEQHGLIERFKRAEESVREESRKLSVLQ